jgi:hypothetical protein
LFSVVIVIESLTTPHGLKAVARWVEVTAFGTPITYKTPEVMDEVEGPVLDVAIAEVQDNPQTGG